MLLDWKDNRLIIVPEVYGIKVFRDIIKRDKSKDKEKTILFFSYLYFMYNPKSDYINIEDAGKRHELVVEEMGIGAIDVNEYKEAIDYYKAHSYTPGLAILRENISSIEKLRKAVNEFDFNSEDISVEKIPLMSRQLAGTFKDLNALAIDIDKTYKILVSKSDDMAQSLKEDASVGDIMYDDI